MKITKKQSVCSIHFGTKWPFFAFNLFKQDVKINDKQYKYRTHGGWFMIVGALLPLVWQQCPWTWSSGLVFGGLLALFVNAVSYIAFKKKVDMAVVKATEEATLVPGRKYYMGIKDADLLIVTINGESYLGVAETAEDIQDFLKDKNTTFEPAAHHINTILYHAQKNDMDICFLTEFGDHIIKLDKLVQKEYPDMLDELLQKEEVLYAIVYKDEGKEMYATANDMRIITCLTENDANIFAQDVYQDYQLEKLTLDDILNIIDKTNGLLIINKDRMVLYNKSSEELAPIVQKYLPENS